MNLLITAEDAIRFAFPANGPIDAALITGSKIRAAQSKYIRPAFPSAFYESCARGNTRSSRSSMYGLRWRISCVIR